MHDKIIIKKYHEDLWSKSEVQEYITNYFDKMIENGYTLSPEAQGGIVLTTPIDDMGFILLNPLFKELVEWVQEEIKKAYYEFYGPELKNFYLGRVWSNKMYKNSNGAWHSHDGNEVVAVFYLNVPKNGAYLITETENVITTNGDLVLHTGTMPHAVSTHNSDEPRISFIFEGLMV
jgi:hypothetical protein